MSHFGTGVGFCAISDTVYTAPYNLAITTKDRTNTMDRSLIALTFKLSVCVYCLGFLGAIPDALVSPIWPATGFQIAMYFVYGRRGIIAMTPGLLIIQFQNGMEGGINTWQAALFAFVSWSAMVSEATITYHLTRANKDRLKNLRTYIRFATFAAPLGCLSSAMQGVTLLELLGVYPAKTPLYAPYGVWLCGNLVGAFALVPLLTLSTQDWSTFKKSWPLSLGFSASFALQLSIMAFALNRLGTHIASPLIAILIYVLIRAQNYVAISIVSCVATLWLASLQTMGYILIDSGNPIVDLFTLQLILITTLSISMMVFHTLREKNELSAKMADDNLRLKELVDERTAKLNQMNQQLIKANEELKQQASTDPLTNIYNRRLFFELGERIFTRCKTGKTPCHLIMLDLDYFKQINDTYGHATGDKVLKTLSECISNTLRPTDLFARIGGEEFAILLTEFDETAVIQLADRIRRNIASLYLDCKGIHVSLTASLGIAASSDHESLTGLFEEADNRLYEAKEKGRNRVEHVKNSV